MSRTRQHALTVNFVVSEEGLFTVEMRSESLLSKRRHIFMQQRMQTRRTQRLCGRRVLAELWGNPVAFARERISRQTDTTQRTLRISRLPVDCHPLHPKREQSI